jgi:Ca2+-binding RTX toxin-like protein
VETRGTVDVSETAEGTLNIHILDANGGTVIVNTATAIVTGGSGNDWFVAGSGNATFIGNGGWDEFDSGTGDATFVGGEGSSYYIEPGSGNVRISSNGDNAELIFDQGIGLDKLSAHTVQNENGQIEYVVAVQGQGTVTLTSDGQHTLPSIGIVGMDGSYDYSVTLSDLLLSTDPAATMSTDTDMVVPAGVVKVSLLGVANLTVQGNELDDTIVANDGDDTLIAGSGLATLVTGHGQDTLVGNGGNTVYQYQLGSGQATILASAAGDVLQFGEGITQNDLSVAVINPVDGTEIIEMLLSSQIAVEIRVDGEGNRVDDVMFADGTDVTLSAMLSGEAGITLVGQSAAGIHV